MLAQRCAFVLGAEQSTMLQHRNHQIDEIVAPARQVRRRDVETVAGALLEPCLHHIGDLVGGADDIEAAHAGDLLTELADGRMVAAHAGPQALADAVHVLRAMLLQRHRTVQWIA